MTTILDPVGVPRAVSGTSALVVPALSGRVVGILSNRWKSMDRMAERMAALLKEKYGAAAVPVYGIPINGAMSDDVRRKVTEECDAAIVGLAN